MRNLYVLLALVCALVALARAGTVVDLTDDNLYFEFQKHSGRDWLLLMVPKPDAPGSQAIVETFRMLAAYEDSFALGLIDCTTAIETCLDGDVSKHAHQPVLKMRTAASENYKYSGHLQSVEAWRNWAYGIRDESVRLVTHLTWQAAMTSSDSWFINFYTPWCAHCNELAPMWTKFALDHKNEFRVAKFDCSAYKQHDICNRQGVSGYPTFIFYHQGQQYLHTGERTPEHFLRTVTRARLGKADYDEGEADRDEMVRQVDSSANQDKGAFYDEL